MRKQIPTAPAIRIRFDQREAAGCPVLTERVVMSARQPSGPLRSLAWVREALSHGPHVLGVRIINHMYDSERRNRRSECAAADDAQTMRMLIRTAAFAIILLSAAAGEVRAPNFFASPTSVAEGNSWKGRRRAISLSCYEHISPAESTSSCPVCWRIERW